MPTRNVNLTDHYDTFVEDLISSGSYKNASEVVRAGLRLLEHEAKVAEQKVELLKKLVAEGFAAIDRGEGISVESDQQLDELIASLGRQAAQRVTQGSKHS